MWLVSISSRIAMNNQSINQSVFIDGLSRVRVTRRDSSDAMIPLCKVKTEQEKYSIQSFKHSSALHDQPTFFCLSQHVNLHLRHSHLLIIVLRFESTIDSCMFVTSSHSAISMFKTQPCVIQIIIEMTCEGIKTIYHWVVDCCDAFFISLAALLRAIRCLVTSSDCFSKSPSLPFSANFSNNLKMNGT